MKVNFSNHALFRMFQRSINPDIIFSGITNGKIIQTYPDDTPYPSKLFLHWDENRPIHILASEDEESKILYIITVYEPDIEKWNDTFTERRIK